MSHLYFSSSTDRIITDIVGMILGQPGARHPTYLGDQKVHFETGVLIDFTLEVYDDRLEWTEREKTKARRHYFLACCGNTNVFIANRDRGRGNGLKSPDQITTDEWINLGNHDSCWTDSIQRFLRETRDEMGAEVNSEAALADLETECEVGFAGRLWQLVEITTGPNPKRDSYWRKLIDIKNIRFPEERK